jgi:hypothetical protein
MFDVDLELHPPDSVRHPGANAGRRRRIGHDRRHPRKIIDQPVKTTMMMVEIAHATSLVSGKPENQQLK